MWIWRSLQAIELIHPVLRAKLRKVKIARRLRLARIARNGTWVQRNIGSLSGLYSEDPRALAGDLLQRGLPVIWGTDL